MLALAEQALILERMGSREDSEEVEREYRRVAASTSKQVRHPIPYVRSFYFLGKLHENRGELEEARELYRRFVSFWEEGDLDRARVEGARTKIGN